MTINKQALREEFQYMQEHYSDPADHDRQVIYISAEALLDELEAAEKLIDTLRQDKDKVIDMSIERVNKLLSRAEAAEKRIAELEAREVVLPQRMEPEGYHIDEAYLVAAEDGDYFDRDEVIEAILAAGISIKGE